jgi:hypothetical protein
MRAALLIGILTFGAACGTQHGGTDIGCRTDARAETYRENLVKDGALGRLRFRLVRSDPGPPVRGDNTWQVEVTDASDQPVSGVILTAVPFMPDHGHGTSRVPEVTASGGGFQVRPVNLFMPGLWEVTLSAQSSAGTDSTVFGFCIEG